MSTDQDHFSGSDNGAPSPWSRDGSAAWQQGQQAYAPTTSPDPTAYAPGQAYSPGPASWGPAATAFPPTATVYGPGAAPYPPQLPYAPAPKPSRRWSRFAVGASAAAVAAVVAIAAVVVVPLLQRGPTLAATAVTSIYSPAIDGVSNSATTTTNPSALFQGTTATGCSAGVAQALASSEAVQVVEDSQTDGSSEAGYVAVYDSVSDARSATSTINTSLLACTGFSATTSHLSSALAYGSYTGQIGSGSEDDAYSGVVLVQYGDVVSMTFVTGTPDVSARATLLKSRIDSLG